MEFKNSARGRNTNRFRARPGDQQYLTVIDVARFHEGANAVVGKIPSGGFPREFSATADGSTVFLSNFSSKSLQVLDVARLRDIVTSNGAPL
jgi:hypothetical protein